MTTQNTKILSFLQRGKNLTSLQALKLFGCLRLSGRIFELRDQGYAIKGEFVTVGKKHIMRYSL